MYADDLAKAIVKDAESDILDENENIIEKPIIYEGNTIILTQSQL